MNYYLFIKFLQIECCFYFDTEANKAHANLVHQLEAVVRFEQFAKIVCQFDLLCRQI